MTKFVHRANEVMSERYKIRPKIREQEALSSYLFRLAEANGTNFLSILIQISTTKNSEISARRYYHIDINPAKKIDIKLLSQLTCISIEELQNHTFFPVLKSVFEDPAQNADQSTFQLGNLYVSQHRRFCRMCLKKEIKYHLIWQLKDIEVCVVHGVKLENDCLHCGKIQPYSKANMEYCTCIYCESNLRTENLTGSSIVHIDENQLRLYEIWSYMLESTKRLTPRQLSLSLEQTIALKILYLSQEERLEYRFASIRYLSGQEKVYLRNLALGQKTDGRTSYLGIVIRFFRKSKISLEYFHDVDVASEYFQSFIGEKKTLETGTCLAPWCHAAGTSNEMSMIQSFHGMDTHKNVYFCGKCFNTYGYSKSSGVWEDIGNRIHTVYNVILPLMEQGLPRKRMIQLLDGISARKISEMFGYMYCQNMIPKGYPHLKGVDKSPPNDLLSMFQLLKNQVGTYAYNMSFKAQELFGWTVQEFFCYFYQSQVQHFIFNEPKRVKKPRIHKNVHGLIREYIAECEREKKECSTSDFENNHGIPRHALQYYGLHEEIAIAKEDQKEQIMQSRYEQFWELTQMYVNNKLECGEPFNRLDVYKAINKRRKWISENCPDLIVWINEQVIISEEQQKKRQLKLDERKIKESILFLNKNEISISKASIMRVSGIAAIKLTGNTELSDYYYHLLNSDLLK
ncbi:hypothetical protein J2T13_000697 [Paenibacillus sp. DS2015]|uniref:TniQ family protein n=1 Tax=Paenibacillus sp. DS2015 TaxID=3373917 RepID=UPI003D1A4C82